VLSVGCVDAEHYKNTPSFRIATKDQFVPGELRDQFWSGTSKGQTLSIRKQLTTALQLCRSYGHNENVDKTDLTVSCVNVRVKTSQ